ncbi:glycosyltransferase [Brevundimonas sp. R86498]|uniref:glycosyltransferase family 2 protein n=1 Tax=Brevundimonas sp. R86498 TaxID=3093845 RepID=UPI0037C71800
MKTWLRRLRRFARGRTNDKGRRTEHLDRADAARDRGDWVEAADHYALHLKERPRDFGIWVQQGHALKEGGRVAEADASYGRALSLQPYDVDLLLNYGHLKKLRLDLEGAAKLYAAAARLDPRGPAILELAAAPMAPFRTPAQERLLDTAAGAALAPLCSGLTLINSRNVIPLGDSRFEMTSSDPWLEFRLQTAFTDGLAELTLEAASLRPGSRLDGRLYVDYGDGYSHVHAVDLPETADGRVTVYLTAVEQIRTLRWDPDDKGNIIRFVGIGCRQGVDVEQAIARVRAAYPPEVELDKDFDRVRRILSTSRVMPEAAIEVSRILGSAGAGGAYDYPYWLRRWINPNRADYARIAEMTAAMTRRPTFSFVMPVYNPPIALLAECIDSMLAQTYPDFEICIADDRSPDPEVRDLLESYAARDARIKLALRPHNGHISAASNTALGLATGEFVVLMDHDDLVPDYCLFVVAHYLNRYPDAQVLYSDEDKVSVDGRRFDPYLKGEFDPFLMYGHNMVSHLGVYRRDLVERIGGFRLGLEGSQDYDLLLRAYEVCGAAAVVHIPHVLYHWRAIPGSTAVSADQKGYAIVAAQHAINGHFERTGLPLRSADGFAPGLSAVRRSRDFDTRVSIIIPTRDGLDVLRDCVRSILAFDHANTEVLIVDNGSEQPETLAYLKGLEAAGVARVIAWPHPFNFSEINNVAAREATGDILCFLNNDTEVRGPLWLARARTLLSIPDVGIVGARLLFPDGTLQHFGITLGMGAHRIAGTPHGGQAGDNPGYLGKARLLHQFGAVTAACLFIRRDVFEAVRGFDADFRVAYNDVDLCLRVRKAGFKVLADPDIVLTHKESKTRGSDLDGAGAERLAREAALMRERWADMLDHDPFYSPNLSLDRSDFALAHPPRVPMPWRETVGEAPVKVPVRATRRKRSA